jgi:protein PhnA
MSTAPACPVCAMENTYADGDNFICPDCAHEWPQSAAAAEAGDEAATVIKDANGTPLADGDSVILIKDLKVKGSSITLKKGTKVKSIRLVGGDHDVDCKIDGISMSLKSEFLKKA